MYTKPTLKKDHSDAELLKRILLREPGWQMSFSELFEYYQKDIYTRALSLLGEHSDAEDMVQEVFIRLYRFAHQFDGQSSLKTWILRITENQCYTLLQKQNKQVKKIARLQAINLDDDLTDSVIEVDEQDNKSKIHLLLAQLDPRIRDILYLRYWLDLSVPQVASLIDISLSACKMRLSRALNHSKTILINT